MDTAAFSRWLASHGGYIHPHIDLFHPCGNDDRGVHATKPIKEGEQLMLVPLKCTLHCIVKSTDSSVDTAVPGDSSVCAAGEYLSSLNSPVSPFIATVLLLLSEVSKTGTSFYQQYIQCLPESVGTLLTWTKEERALLAGTAIADDGESTEAVFRQSVLPLVHQRPDLWPSGVCTFQHFCRCAEWVQSRAFHMVAENWVTGANMEGQQLYLIPGIDMINHSTRPEKRNTSLLKIPQQMTVEVDGKSISFNGFFTMKAESDIAAGQEVLHTYGDLSDGQLLQTYGFVENIPDFTNPHNIALIPWSILQESCVKTCDDPQMKKDKALLQKKLSMLERCKLLQSAAPDGTHFVVNSTDPVPDVMVTAVQVMMMSRQDFEQLESDLGDSSTLSIGKAVLQDDPEFSQGVCLALLKAVDMCLQQYPTILSQDQQLLKKAAQLPIRQKFAAQVCCGEKLLLAACKKQTVMLMVELQQRPRKRRKAGGGSKQAVDDDEDDDEDEDEDEDDEDEDEDGSDLDDEDEE